MKMRYSLQSKPVLALFLVFFSVSTSFAQWQKQSLPPLDDMLYYPVAKGKNTMWATTVNYGGFPENTGRMQIVNTTDGGKSYKVQVLFDNLNYDAAIYPYDENTAYLLAAKYGEPTYFYRRTIDAGETWQDMPYKPTSFPDIVHFFSSTEGVLISDPDSIGTNIAITQDGGTTYTRLSQSNVPRMEEGKDIFIIGGNFQALGNTLFTASLDVTTGLWRVWRSIDRGRNWTAGEDFDSGDSFIPRIIFSDADNGLILRGHTSGTTTSIYTHDGGATWHEGTLPPGQNTFMLDIIPNTQTMLSVFLDPQTQMQYSMATNDLGKTWHSRTDIGKYTLDTIFAPLGVPTLVYTLGDIVDNHTAWAKIEREGLYRYESTTPLAQENPDLELEIKADNEGLPLYGYVKYTLTVRNRGISAATGVKINWLPPYNRTPNAGNPYAYVSAYADKGRYDSWNGIWEIEKLEAGAMGTASFHLFVLDNTKDVTQKAQIIACNEKDIDSSPNNMSGAAREDDEVGYMAKPSIENLLDNLNYVKKIDPSTVSVSPNPTSEKLNIVIGNESELEWRVKILNTVGQVVYSQNGQYSSNLEVNVKNLPNGMYIVDYQSDKINKTKRILVQH